MKSCLSEVSYNLDIPLIKVSEYLISKGLRLSDHKISNTTNRYFYNIIINGKEYFLSSYKFTNFMKRKWPEYFVTHDEWTSIRPEALFEKSFIPFLNELSGIPEDEINWEAPK